MSNNSRGKLTYRKAQYHGVQHKNMLIEVFIMEEFDWNALVVANIKDDLRRCCGEYGVELFEAALECGDKSSKKEFIIWLGDFWQNRAMFLDQRQAGIRAFNAIRVL